MIISPFTPLFFSPSTDKFGAKSKYVQLFARTDRIFVELILTAKEQEPIVYINNLLSNLSFGFRFHAASAYACSAVSRLLLSIICLINTSVSAPVSSAITPITSIIISHIFSTTVSSCTP